MRSLPWLTPALLLLAPLASADPVAEKIQKAQLTNATEDVEQGVWVRYKRTRKTVVKGVEPHKESETYEETWWVRQVEEKAYLVQVYRKGQPARYVVFPRTNGETISADYVVASITLEYPRRISRRPPKPKRPKPPKAERLLTFLNHPQWKHKLTLSAKKAKLKLTHKARHANGDALHSRTIDAKLDPTLPGFGLLSLKQKVKDTTLSYKSQSTIEETLKLVERGKGFPEHVEGGDVPDTKPTTTNDWQTGKLAKGKLAANPFAKLTEGSEAVFDVVIKRARPLKPDEIEIEKGRVLVSIVQYRGRLQFKFNPLSGSKLPSSLRWKYAELPPRDERGQWPATYMSGLIPQLYGQLGMPKKCDHASVKTVKVKVGKKRVEAEHFRISFGADKRYEAVFTKDSPVGWTSYHYRHNMGEEHFWDEATWTLNNKGK